MTFWLLPYLVTKCLIGSTFLYSSVPKSQLIWLYLRYLPNIITTLANYHDIALRNVHYNALIRIAT
jgi:hypothetical protein